MLKIAIQGYEASFHHIAAIKYFGRNIEILPKDTFREVAKAVKNGEANMGQTPVIKSVCAIPESLLSGQNGTFIFISSDSRLGYPFAIPDCSLSISKSQTPLSGSQDSR